MELPGDAFLEFMGVPSYERFELSLEITDAMHDAAMAVLEAAARTDDELALYLSDEWARWRLVTGEEAGPPRVGMTLSDGFVVITVTNYWVELEHPAERDRWGYRAGKRSLRHEDWPATRLRVPVPFDATALLREIRARESRSDSKDPA